jgi:hypothetical protein
VVVECLMRRVIDMISKLVSFLVYWFLVFLKFCAYRPLETNVPRPGP